MILLRILLRLMFGDPDGVHQDETTWPTWVVVTIFLVVIAALVGGYFLLAHAKATAP